MDSSLPPPPLRSRVPAAEDSESRAHATLTVDTEALTEARVVKKKKKRWAIMIHDDWFTTDLYIHSLIIHQTCLEPDRSFHGCVHINSINDKYIVFH
ncbi:hypothetical protein QTG54_006300 [Skeletonema marinoi]|uniref:Uncharacterized protein n=1 Tax=Skeletonema marinoi TaxID=267567 RepID=A0AAD8YAM2_9STRA|nr:hypothetical protein QTG54_006300 [Skeletonema marinoi]